MHDRNGCQGSNGINAVRILALETYRAEMSAASQQEAHARIDAIFFASSQTTQFASETERQSFRERWLGRYLVHYPAQVWVAVEDRAGVVGYLAGCLDDPARTPLFSDIGYFALLADLTRQHPAHLHINIDPGWRGLGIGARLIGAYCSHARAQGSRGVHVVTGQDARNVRFYRRYGFHPLRSLAWNGSHVVFLGRSLA